MCSPARHVPRARSSPHPMLPLTCLAAPPRRCTRLRSTRTTAAASPSSWARDREQRAHELRRLTRPRAACGWSGVLDITALAVTHVHCPPPPWLLSTEVRCAWPAAVAGAARNATRVSAATNAGAARAVGHQAPPRVGTGRHVHDRCARGACRSARRLSLTLRAAGTRAASAVHVLDFGATPRAACHVARNACAPECVDDQPCRSCQRPLTLRTTAPVTVTAVHPLHDAIAAGTQVR